MVAYLRFVKMASAPSFTKRIEDGQGRTKLEGLRDLREQFLGILDDMDSLLGTTPFFMFGPWVEGAKSFSKLAPSGKGSVHDPTAEEALYEFNARNLVTMWGPDGQISDYSARLWSGLISDYYKPRWKIALDSAIEQVEKGAAEPNDGPFGITLRKFEQGWQRMHKTFPTEGSGSAVDQINAMHGKYKALVEASCTEKNFK
jgi:alpha-N-acetylglucosaminidase